MILQMLHAGGELECDSGIFRPDCHNKASEYQSLQKPGLIDELASTLIAVFQCLARNAQTLRQRLSCPDFCSESLHGGRCVFECLPRCVQQTLEVRVCVKAV